MDVTEAVIFARRHHRAVLATRTVEGGIQQSPVLVGVDEQDRFTVSTRESAYKVKNLRRDPWAQLCVLTDEFFGPWVFAEGTAEVLSLPEAMEPLVDYFRTVAGEHEDWEEYRQGMREERRVLVRVTPRKAGPSRQG